MALLLSQDAELSEDDRVLDDYGVYYADAEYEPPTLDSNPLFWRGFASVPHDVTPGNYYLLFVIDPDNGIPESDESNNLHTAAVEIVQ